MNISSKLNEIIFSVWNNEKIESEIFNSTIESLKIYEKLAIIKEIQLKNNKLFIFKDQQEIKAIEQN